MLGTGLAFWARRMRVLEVRFHPHSKKSGAPIAVARVLSEASYSRAAETDADAYAVTLMERMGADPRALGGFLTRLSGESPGPEPIADGKRRASDPFGGWLSSHPDSADRKRRIDAGLNPDVGSVASLFISRWDVAVAGKAPEALRDQLGIAIAKRTYKASRALLTSPRWERVYNFGARPQRLLWASTGTKDPKASDILYVKALAAPFTVNTMPEGTLKALAAHTEIGEPLPVDGGNCEEVLAQFAKAGIDVDALAAQLQDEGGKSFVKSWNDLLAVISSKCALLNKSGAMKSSG